MNYKVVDKNISNRNTFRVECQKCKCKKIRIELERGRFSDEYDDYYFVCNHCGFRSYVI